MKTLHRNRAWIVLAGLLLSIGFLHMVMATPDCSTLDTSSGTCAIGAYSISWKQTTGDEWHSAIYTELPTTNAPPVTKNNTACKPYEVGAATKGLKVVIFTEPSGRS